MGSRSMDRPVRHGRDSAQGEIPPRAAGNGAAGFSLLEVLVVVAVIALLAAILLPSLDRARQQTRRVLCQSNLKQLDTAWEAFFRDSNDRFLRGVNIAYNYGGRQGRGSAAFGSRTGVPKPLNRHLQLDPVLRSGGEVFACPSDAGTRFIKPSAAHYYGTSYLPNLVLIGENYFAPPMVDPCRAAGLWTQVNQRLTRLTRASIGSPARVLFLGDYCWFDTWDPTLPDDFPEWHQVPSMHNFVFLDGHGEFVRIDKGIHVSSRYRLIPFDDLTGLTGGCQKEVARN